MKNKKREIKFRAWDIDKKEMSDCNDIWFLDDAPFNSIFNNKKYIFMLFTGLKDKNGKKIYEGDIVRENTEAFGKSELKYVVGFDRGHFTLTETTSGYDKMGIWNVNSNMEIIGNIYENPELLGGEK